MTWQIDFGNLAVGIGTALIAWVSFKSISRGNNANIAEYRRLWIEDLRRALAEMCSLLIKRPNSALSDEEQKRLYELMSYVQMMLNPHDNPTNEHAPLENAVKSAIAGGNLEQFGHEVDEIIKHARVVFKKTWETVKTETLGNIKEK